MNTDRQEKPQIDSEKSAVNYLLRSAKSTCEYDFTADGQGHGDHGNTEHQIPQP